MDSRERLLGDAEDFRGALAAWFRKAGKEYPWRRTVDPYAILVSEVMLQQTQIATVLGPRHYYARWLQRFPDAASLAAAREEEVLKAWEGLGYYSRARNLQRAARVVVEEHGGVFPDSAAEIRKLPGVGRYTAGAVASFAFDAPEPIVDANVARVLARIFDYREQVDSARGQAQLWAWAGALVPRKGARVYNSALMELGQRVCTPAAPGCGECPVGRFCRSRGGDPEALPVKKARKKTERVDEHALWAVRGKRLLLAQERSGRRRGLWKLPERTLAEVGALPLVLKMQYSITHYRVQLRVYGMDLPEEAPERDAEEWVALGELDSLAMGSPYRRAVRSLLEAAPGDSFSLGAEGKGLL